MFYVWFASESLSLWSIFSFVSLLSWAFSTFSDRFSFIENCFVVGVFVFVFNFAEVNQRLDAKFMFHPFWSLLMVIEQLRNNVERSQHDLLFQYLSLHNSCSRLQLDFRSHRQRIVWFFTLKILFDILQNAAFVWAATHKHFTNSRTHWILWLVFSRVVESLPYFSLNVKFINHKLTIKG